MARELLTARVVKVDSCPNFWKAGMTDKKDATDTQLPTSKKMWAKRCRHLISRLDQTTAKLVAPEVNVEMVASTDWHKQMVKEIALRRKAKKGILHLRRGVHSCVAVKLDPIKN